MIEFPIVDYFNKGIIQLGQTWESTALYVSHSAIMVQLIETHVMDLTEPYSIYHLFILFMY